MRQEVAEETADQKTEQVISYERIERQVEEVEKKADQRQGLKKDRAGEAGGYRAGLVF